MEVRKTFSRACRETKIADFHLHDLRHSFGEMMVSNGGTLFEAQILLGYQDQTITLRYAYLSQDAMRKASQRVAEQIEKAAGCFPFPPEKSGGDFFVKINYNISIFMLFFYMEESDSMPQTEREEIEALLGGSDFLRRILDSILDGVVLVDADGRIIFANDSAGKVLGISRDELIGAKAQDLPLAMYVREGEEIPRESKPFAVALRSGGRESQNVLIKRPDGSTLPVLFKIDQTEKGPVVAILSDASETMRRQQQVDEYYRVLAHDLRTPLTVVLGHAELLQASPTGDEAMAPSLRAIIDAGEQMEAITDEMGDRLQLESGHFELKKEGVQIEELIKDVVFQLTSKETKHRLEVQAPSLPVVQADANRLQRVLINLITNAMKYSPEGSTISVTAWENTKGIMTKVTDRGHGIKSQDLNYIFDPFFITSVGKEKGGVGLGLYIARLTVEAHGGRIYVSSTEEGTSFAFFLPKA